MKKLISMLLCLLLLLPIMAGCSEGSGETTEESIEHTLRVGFGRADFTPTESMPIGDPYLGPYKMSTEVINPLLATCIAFTDEADNTVLLFHMDLGGINDAQVYARSVISKKIGVPATQIMVTATHTHATPRVVTDNAMVMEWRDSIQDKMLEAAEAAMADRKPAQMYTTSIQCENLNFIRHYIMDDGSYVGDNFGSAAGKTYVEHTEDADNTLQLIKFVREGGKDVILANWQGHPHRLHGGSGTTIGSDIVGAMRDKMEAELDCCFAYFSGASGNINNKSRIKEEQITADYLEHGNALAAYAIQATENFQQQEIGKVQLISSMYKAQNKSETSSSELPLYAFSLGDVAFVTAPYEMFNSQGMKIKADSPFNATFVCTYANGHLGYMPDKKTIDTYECYEETQSRFAAGTAELLTAEHISMLNKLHETRK